MSDKKEALKFAEQTKENYEAQLQKAIHEENKVRADLAKKTHEVKRIKKLIKTNENFIKSQSK